MDEDVTTTTDNRGGLCQYLGMWNWHLQEFLPNMAAKLGIDRVFTKFADSFNGRR